MSDIPDYRRLYTERLGFLSVMVLSSKTTTVNNKTQIIEDIVFLKNEKPCMATVRWTKVSQEEFDYKVGKIENISEDKYKKLVSSGPAD